MPRSAARFVLFCFALTLARTPVVPAAGATITVTITGLRNQQGTIRCGLFDGAAGFDRRAPARGKLVEATKSPVVCVFRGLPPGEYAVSVNHDENRNGRIDTNLLGIPTEGWAVTNNVVPGMRAPRYEEARIQLRAGQHLRQTLKLVY